MAWFRKERTPKAVRRGRQASPIPEGLWTKCEGCKEAIFSRELERNLHVCPKCGYHFRIDSQARIHLLLDEEEPRELMAAMRPGDPLRFKDSKKYTDRLKAARSKTGLEEAVVTGLGRIGGYPVAIAALEFAFMGGSMASVVGEKLTRTIELAIAKRVPLVIVSASGGARMQEGILSLMQMAKTAAALQRLSEERLPYISLLTDPTTGGVTASFAMLGDIILAEPRALIGFAGPRVIAETIRQPLPEGFQRSEFVLEHGQIDLVVERRELRETLRKIIAFFCHRGPSTEA